MNTTNTTYIKRFSTLLALFIAAEVLVTTLDAADANPPERLSYQGYLTDANGVALGSTNTGPKNYDVIFRIWSEQSGTEPNKRLWTEQQTVTVDKGYFSVLLGEGSQYASESRPPLSTVFTNNDASDRFVEMTVKGIGAGTPPSDVTILPRLRLLTSPYAFLARNISDGAVTPSKLAGNVGLWTRTGNNLHYSDGNVGIGTATADARLKVSGTLGINSGFDGMGTTYANRGIAGGGVEIGYDNPNGIGNLVCVNESVGYRAMRYYAASHSFNVSGTPPDALTILPTGIGLGTWAPSAQLSLGTTLANTKIALFDDGVNNYGLGIQGGQFRLHLGWPQARFSFLAAADGAELMTIKADGKVGIGTASPGMALDVNGDARAGHVQAVGSNPSFGAFRNGSSFEIGLADGWGAYSTEAAPGDSVFRTAAGKRMLLQNDGGGAAMCISGNNVGFGTTAPATKVHIRGGNYGQLLLTEATTGATWHMFAQSDTSLLVYRGPGYAWCNGVNGVWGAGSDIKLKKDIADLGGVLDRVMKMRPVSYHFKAAPKNAPRSFGFIAQDIEALFPEMVQDNGDELGKGIYYQEIIPVAIGAIQELKGKVDETSKADAARIAALEKEVADLKALVNTLIDKGNAK